MGVSSWVREVLKDPAQVIKVESHTSKGLIFTPAHVKVNCATYLDEVSECLDARNWRMFHYFNSPHGTRFRKRGTIEFFLNWQIWHFCHSCTKLKSRGLKISQKKIASTRYWTHNTNPTIKIPATLPLSQSASPCQSQGGSARWNADKNKPTVVVHRGA